jgi:hypothetical protein
MSDWRKKLKAARLLATQLPSARAVVASESSVSDFMIAKALYSNTRDNIEEVCRQINLSYFYGIYDGAAVLIRKVMEILLILCYKHHGIESSIKDNVGNYQDLSLIVKDASQNTVLDFTRNAKEYLELFREKGNLSAHNPFHISTKADLERLQPKIRHLFQELLFKSGIKR